MQNAMVTARMSQAKKEQGARALKKMGKTANAAINDLFDYIIRHESMPNMKAGSSEQTERIVKLAEAIKWADSISLPADNRFAQMTDDQIKEERLRSKGLL